MPIRLLVVDDSALMRRTIRQAFEVEGDFTVHVARDGQSALEQIQELSPDVVTLDINMPVMDGLTCLSHIMTHHPVPVVMVSSLTEKGALATFEALEMGAVDYVPKPDGTVSLRLGEVLPQLVAKVRAAAGVRPERSTVGRVRTVRARKAQPRPVVATPRVTGLVLIGVSTGGPKTLEDIIPVLPADFPYPVVIAQHMPKRFTKVFAERLDGLSSLTVQEVAHTEVLVPGTAYIGAGGTDVVIERRLGRLVATSVSEDATLWHPSVDRLVTSALGVVSPSQLVGVELTGMGHDGAVAMTELKRQGGHVIAESDRTSVVFGMPREVIERGGASVVLDCTEIAAHLVDHLARKTEPHRLWSSCGQA